MPQFPHLTSQPYRLKGPHLRRSGPLDQTVAPSGWVLGILQQIGLHALGEGSNSTSSWGAFEALDLGGCGTFTPEPGFLQTTHQRSSPSAAPGEGRGHRRFPGVVHFPVHKPTQRTVATAQRGLPGQDPSLLSLNPRASARAFPLTQPPLTTPTPLYTPPFAPFSPPLRRRGGGRAVPWECPSPGRPLPAEGVGGRAGSGRASARSLPHAQGGRAGAKRTSPARRDAGAGGRPEMLRRRRVFAVEPLWSRGGARKPRESCVVPTSASIYRKLQEASGESPDPTPEPQRGSRMSGELGSWGPAGSPTESGLPLQPGLFPKSGRLLKSESEDSGVEMAGNENSPSTPLGSESSFSLDCLDGFQPSAADSAASDPEEGCPEAEGPEESDPLRERAYLRNLSVSKKLAQAVQRSRKLHAPGRSPKPLGQKSLKLLDLELLASYGSQGPGGRGGAVEGHSQALSGCRSLEEQRPESCGEEAEVQRDSSLAVPGQGLRYLEHVCLMLEKIAQLQQANLQLQQQQKAMESRLWGQQPENAVPSAERLCRAPGERGPSQPDLLPEGRAEVDTREEDLPPDCWRPHPFRARSASDTGVLQDLTGSLEDEPARSRKTAMHCVSSLTLLDRPDWGAQTLPPNLRPRNDRSHWGGKVKVLINRITRRSIRASEPSPFGESAVDSRHCSLEASLEEQGPHPRRRFLPALGVKKHRSKPLSVC